jgi:tetratricopeptide (TPR) repeat protein
MNPAARALVAALVVAVAAAPAIVPAEAASDLAEARARFERGSELYERGRYRDAIAEFEAAYRLRPHGTIHYNVAQCREKLGEWPQALRSYHDYLRELPKAEDREQVRKSMRRIEDRLASAGVQALLVSSEPRGAEVGVDGRPRGKTPFVIALPPGSYAVTLALPGHATAARQVDLSLEAYAVVDVTLRPAPAGATAATAAAGTAFAPAAAQPALAPPAPAGPSPGTRKPDLSAPAPDPLTADLPPPGKPPPPPGKRRVWTWVATGAAVVAAGAGAYYGMTAQQKSDQLRDGTYWTAGEATALAEDAKSAQKNANVLYGVAAGAAAAGVTLFFVEGRF